MLFELIHWFSDKMNLLEKAFAKLFNNVHVFSFLKNIIQYLVSFALFYNIYGNANLFTALIGLAGFVIAYQGVYYYNDIIDLAEDKNDEIKKRIKPLARKEVLAEFYVIKIFVYMIFGLLLCFAVSWVFGALVIGTLFLNFIHSTPRIRLKKTPFVGINFFLLQFLKFSSGWVALASTQQLLEIPVYVIGLFAAAYTLGYLVYKKNNLHPKKILREKPVNISLFAVLAFAFLILSFLQYNFKAQIIILFASSFLFLVPIKSSSMRRVISGSAISLLVYALFIISLLFL